MHTPYFAPFFLGYMFVLEVSSREIFIFQHPLFGIIIFNAGKKISARGWVLCLDVGPTVHPFSVQMSQGQSITKTNFHRGRFGRNFTRTFRRWSFPQGKLQLQVNLMYPEFDPT
jgi:hypothetical protein